MLNTNCVMSPGEPVYGMPERPLATSVRYAFLPGRAHDRLLGLTAATTKEETQALNMHS